MITRYDMFEPLLAALPEFRPQWEAFVAEWTDNPANYPQHDPRDLPSYLLLMDLAGYLCDLMEAGRDVDVSKVLAVCERWMLEGDLYVFEAAIAGLLESLETNARLRNLDLVRFTPLLGPRGRKWWEMNTNTDARATVAKPKPKPKPPWELVFPWTRK